MNTPSEQFVTAMKLRQLRAQRDRLRTAYSQLADQAAAASLPAERISILAEGLGQLTFANQPFHPEVAAVELLLPALRAGHCDATTVDFWEAYLGAELRRGQQRAEAVYRFGMLLDEWSRSAPVASAHAAEVTSTLLARASAATPAPSSWHALLDAAIPPETTADLRARIEELMVLIGAPVDPSEVELVLAEISREPTRSTAVRAEATSILGSELGAHELADALTILIDSRKEWQWPEEGVLSGARWSRTRWRLFLDEDLPTACLLEVLAARWQRVFRILLGDVQDARRARLRQLRALKAPRVIIANERRILEAAGSALEVREHDLWGGDGRLAEHDEQEIESGSVCDQRTAAMRALREFQDLGKYGDGQHHGPMAQAAALINAEIMLARAAHPDRPVTLIKVDLRDFYASIPHDLVLDLLARLGLPEVERSFFERYLAIPLRQGEHSMRIRRGLPVMRGLSDILSELVLRLLDAAITNAARVRLIRVKDDLCIIASEGEQALLAWQALRESAAACGLEPNVAKCGTTVVGGTALAGLPSGPFTWQMLRLNSDGTWVISNEALDTLLEQARWRMERATTLLSKIELYNQHLTLLTTLSSPTAALGAAHRDSLAEALARVQRELWGPELSLALSKALQERIPDMAAELPVTEAWLTWPLTAGGLGLRSAQLMIAPGTATLVELPPTPIPRSRPEDWQRRANVWSALYEAALREVTPAEPVGTPMMTALANDFIRRGAELSDGEQDGLSTYWRWVLAIHGPQILSDLGSFRFLVTAYVPLQLIARRRLSETEAGALMLQAPA